MSVRIREYKFFRSLSVKVNDNWPVRKAEQLWRQMRAHKIAEIEAAEACKWLRAAGFPQYAQMYEEMQFPVDVVAAQQDHPLLEPAVLHSLFRRLHALNRCARVRQQPNNTHIDDSEDEQCALSDNWTYQSDIRRWSRNCQTMQIPNIEESSSKEWWCSSNRKEESGSSPAKEPVAEGLRRIQSSTSKFRRKRDGVVVRDSGPNVLDALTKQLGSLNYDEGVHYSDSECGGTLGRKFKTRSLDKADSWANSSIDAVNSNLWDPTSVAESEECAENQNKGALADVGRSVATLSCIQLQVLRKLALLKLTAHMEKYCPSHRTGWNWELPKFIRKIKAPAYKDKSVFGVPLMLILQRIGQPLPRCIQEALQWLQQNATDQVGIFRKPGVRSRIQALKVLMETQGENLDFSDQQAYDVADVVKQYFRELPEALLTNKLSETFILIFQYVPPFLRKEAVICALLLMPDEHREVLQALMAFLLQIAEHSNVNQMNANNLAICFAPSLFQYSQNWSLRQGIGSSQSAELIENKAAHECLLYFLKNSNTIFKVPVEFLNQCKVNEIKESIAVQLSELGGGRQGGWQAYLEECQAALLREAKERSRGWVVVPCNHPKTELSYKKVADGHPLRLWKVCTDIAAPPTEVINRILRDRHIWDEDLHSSKIVAQMNKSAEVFHIVRRNIEPLSYTDYCVIRTWKTDLPKGGCVIVETSVGYPDAPHIPNSIRGIVLASRYLIEPGGSGQSRLMHLSRVDTRGRMPEWYHKNYGHLSAVHIANLQASFNVHQSTTGPESKV